MNPCFILVPSVAKNNPLRQPGRAQKKVVIPPVRRSLFRTR